MAWVSVRLRTITGRVASFDDRNSSARHSTANVSVNSVVKLVEKATKTNSTPRTRSTTTMSRLRS